MMTKNAYVLALALLLESACSTQGPRPEAKRDYAYWLMDSPRSEYVDLLIAGKPIEQLASATFSDTGDVSPDSPAIIVTTYKRDSIWNIDRRPFKAVMSVRKAEGEMQATINDKRYEYEPVPLLSVIALLDNPEGSIAIHRIYAPLGGAEEFAKALTSRLKQQVRNAPDKPTRAGDK